jgi:LPXTG-motif cell wall-anchored protein
LAGSLQAGTADIANNMAPGAMAILGVGLLGIGSLARRKKSS